MDERQIRQALENITNQEIADDMNLWPEIEKRLDQRARWVPRTRLGWALAVLALLITAGATAYAVNQFIHSSDPGLEAMDEANRITHLNLTQPIEGAVGQQYNLRATLEYAFADANRITVAFNVSGEAKASEQIQFFLTPTLTDDRGTPYVWLPIGGGGGGGGGSSDPDALLPFTSGMTTNFDASALADAPDELQLQLKVEVAYTAAAVSQPDPNGMLMAGSAVFEFGLPFNPGRVMDTPQTVTAGGIEMTLQKAVVAPSLTRLEMCYADPAPQGQIWEPSGRVEIGGQEIVPETSFVVAGQGGLMAEESDACRSFILPEALDTYEGEWIVMITELQYTAYDEQELIRRLREDYGINATPMPDGSISYDSSQPREDIAQALEAVSAAMTKRITGPWVFRFTLP